MEIQLDVHSCELVGQVPEHVGQSNFSTVVRIADAADYFFSNGELLVVISLVLHMGEDVVAFKNLPIYVSRKNTAAFSTHVAL